LKKMRNSFLLYLLFLLQPVTGQMPASPFDLPDYGFIRYNTNFFELVENNPAFQNLFTKFDSLIGTGNNKISIVHLGGSHIQADVYTHRIRQDMQSFYPGVLGSRGFFFPYSLAHTNNPSNLWITYSGDWQTCKNTQKTTSYPMGLSGITSELTSAAGSIEIVARYDTLRHYDFNRIRIYCNAAETGIVPEINTAGEAVDEITVHPSGGYVQYRLNRYSDTLIIRITQPDSSRFFQLYGISLENDDPGVVYNAIGVNGAKLESYLRCNLFVPQLRTLEPDWVIISIGTNEGNTREFDEAAYRNNYRQLLDSVRLAAPEVAILLTVPNDSYLYKRYINTNTARMRQIIFDIARANGCGVWDFYTVMGGLNSVKAWYDQGLMNKDHIHFSKPGYLLKGDLFFSAFLTSWDNHLLQVAAESKRSLPGLHTLTPVMNQPASNTLQPLHD
jgi:lysophospholipase L1-like esterase